MSKYLFTIFALIGALILTGSMPATAQVQARNEQNAVDRQAIIQLNNFIATYHQNPDTDRALENLRSFFNSEYFKSGQARQFNIILVTAYGFARLAEMNPGLVEEYKTLFEESGHDARVMLLNVFRILGTDEINDYLKAKLEDETYADQHEAIQGVVDDELTFNFDVLQKEITGTVDLDLLWAEFGLTGNTAVIDKVISVIEKPDRFREIIAEYMASDTPEDEKENTLSLLRDVTGIEADPETGAVEGDRDLDLIVAAIVRNQPQNDQLAALINDALKIPQQDVLHMVLKGSAVWSLSANSRGQNQVFEYVASRADQVSPKVRPYLFSFALEGYQMRNRPEEAIRVMESWVNMDPENIGLFLQLGFLYAEYGQLEKAREVARQIAEEAPEQSAALMDTVAFEERFALLDGAVPESKQSSTDLTLEDITQMMTEALRGLESYESIMELVDKSVSVPFKEHFTLEWVLEHQLPENFSVFQTTWQAQGPSVERWITVDGTDYIQLGAWYERPEQLPPKSQPNNAVRIEKWVDIISSSEVEAIRAAEANGESYYVLKLNPKDIQAFIPNRDVIEAEYSAEVWIRQDTHYPVSCQLSFEGEGQQGRPLSAEYRQAFMNFNSVPEITVPENVRQLEVREQAEEEAATAEE